MSGPTPIKVPCPNCGDPVNRAWINSSRSPMGLCQPCEESIRSTAKETNEAHYKQIQSEAFKVKAKGPFLSEQRMFDLYDENRRISFRDSYKWINA